MRRTRFVARALAVVIAVTLATPAARAVTGAPVASKIDPALAKAMAATPGKVGVIAQLTSPPTDADVAAMRAAGFLPGMIRYSVVDAIYAEGPATAVHAFSRNSRVTHIEHDAVIPYALEEANKAGRTAPVWDADYELAGTLQSGGFTGKGVGIAIVDTGVDARHPDLLWKPLADATGKTAKTIANYKVVGRDSVEITALSPEVDEVAEANTLAIDMVHTDVTGGHGTHVAGIAAGSGAGDSRFKGAAPGADLIGYGAGDTLLVHSGLAAFDHIHRNHEALNIRVVNSSWGGAGDWNPDYAVTKAVRKLANEDGLLMVFAAGNSGGDGTDLQTSVWGNIPEVLQVANYYDRRGWVDDTSSRGLKSNEDTWPDVAGPGTQVISAAAAGGPVTAYGTAQDALIARLFGYDEPYVVSAPTGGAVDLNVNGQEVIVGDYASFTGTSMAAPFIAGVAALVFEANPDLTWSQVRDILRETANLPTGRTYADDGYAIGTGVVDGAHAVAVALKMRDGATLADALLSASLDLTTTPAQINTGAGPVIDNSIPLAPAPGSLVTGRPQMFHGSIIDLSLATGDPVFVPGELVGMTVRNVQSSNSAEAPVSKDNVTARLVITRDGVSVATFSPDVATTSSVDGSTSFGLTYSADWTIPETTPLGTYVFESYTTIISTGVTYQSSSLPFHVGTAS